MHPIFEVDRDASGKLTHFAVARPGRQSEHARESYIRVHVPQIRDKAARELGYRPIYSEEQAFARTIASRWPSVAAISISPGISLTNAPLS